MNKVEFIPLKYIKDERGAVLHYLKISDPIFSTFGESYFSWINPGYIKGWYRHKKLSSYITSPTANLQIVLFSEMEKKFFEFEITETQYGLIKIPQSIWYSFKSINTKPALVANILSGLYDPGEVEKLAIDTENIPYRWNAENA